MIKERNLQHSKEEGKLKKKSDRKKLHMEIYGIQRVCEKLYSLKTI